MQEWKVTQLHTSAPHGIAKFYTDAPKRVQLFRVDDKAKSALKKDLRDAFPLSDTFDLVKETKYAASKKGALKRAIKVADEQVERHEQWLSEEMAGLGEDGIREWKKDISDMKAGRTKMWKDYNAMKER